MLDLRRNLIFKLIGYLYLIKFIDSVFFKVKKYNILFIEVGNVLYSLIVATLAIVFLYLGYKNLK